MTQHMLIQTPNPTPMMPQMMKPMMSGWMVER